jgi:hypothetical protein
MAAIGLFTLNTSELNEGILGGLGTGFAEQQPQHARPRAAQRVPPRCRDQQTARVWQPVPQAGHLVWVARQVMRPHAQQPRRVHLRLRVGQVMSRHVAQPRRVHLTYSVRQVQRAQDRQARKAHQMCHHRPHHHRHHLHLMLPWVGRACSTHQGRAR